MRDKGDEDGTRETHRIYCCFAANVLNKRFSKSNELEELHKHHSGKKDEEYERFHEAKRKAKKEAAATGTAMPDDLALTTTVAEGVSCGRVCGVRLEAVHLRAKSGQAPSCRGLAPIWPCCFDMLRRMDLISSSVYDAFD
ncbi:hypothetical protein M9H77_31645 [Catharanthus roseus]|uniref:Uncharacterized protein n=1 Tax=Catharanthus roseus TaxID=4058 RepID=A0ACC0A4X3_CATRO|nr:hypothetical protein M9H77_31645 [Catharanthus roseus]